MEEPLDYIERYFRGELSAEERVSFEERCVSDTAFSETVVFYISSRQQIREELQEQKRAEFQDMYLSMSRSGSSAISPVRRLTFYISAAAACLLLVVGWWVFFRGGGSRQMADEYIKNNFTILSVTMSGSRDSVQQGLDAYNKGDHARAEALFSALVREYPQDMEVRKYLGIVFLAEKQYDKALVQFDSLAARQDLYSNPGLFYKALTLMERATGDDRAKAKIILQEVVNKKLPGSVEASQWIERL